MTVAKYKKNAQRVILLDDYGTGRLTADFCVDTLLYPPDQNIPQAKQGMQSLEYLILGDPPPKANLSQEKKYDLFLYWGVNDPFGIEEHCLTIVKDYVLGKKQMDEKKRAKFPSMVLFVNKKKHEQQTKLFLDLSDYVDIFTYKDDYEHFISVLQQSKICLTYFSMTMYEAWIMNTLPVLFAPSQYHHGLAQAAVHSNAFGQNKCDIFSPGQQSLGAQSWEQSFFWILEHFSELAQKTRYPLQKPQELSFSGARKFAQWLMEQCQEQSYGL